MKTTKQTLVIFLITLITISSISSIGGFAGSVKACESSVTSLTLSKTSPQSAGTSLTATATVSPSAATGSITFQVEIPGSGTWSTFSTKTLASGSATSQSYTLTTAGVYSFQAVYSGDSIYSGSTSPCISLTVNPSAAVNFVVSGFPSPTVAGVAHSVTVTAKDAYGNVATGYTGTVHFTSSDGQAVLPANYIFVYSDSGAKSFSATLKTVGSQSITATDTVTSVITGSQSGITVNAAGASKLAFIGVPSSLTAGVTSGGITVQLQDPYGNPVNAGTGGVTVTLSPSGIWYSNSGGTSPINNNQVTISSGSSSSSSFYFLSTVAGLVSLVASATGYTSASASLIVNAAGATSFVVSGFPSPTVAGVAHSVTVTAKDAYGNVVTGFSGAVTITSSDLAATLPSGGTLTSGVGSFGVTLKTSGTQSITATSGSVSGSQTGIQVNAGSAVNLVVSAPGSAAAGTAFSVTVTAKDLNGNTVTSYGGTVHFTSSDGQAVLPANSVLSNGVGSFSVTLKTAGSQTVTGTDTVTSSITGTSGPISVSFASGGATKLVVSAPSSAVAGTVFSVTVTAVDQFGNTVTSYGGTVHFTSSDGQAVLPANSVLSNGVGSFSVTLKTAGSQTVTGTDTVTSSITGTSGPISVSFASGGATKLVVSAPSSAVAGTVFSVTVTAVDQFGNTVTSYGGTVHFTSSDGQAVLPANSVLSNGVGSFSVTLKTAGSQTVTGTDTVTSSITGTSGPISVSFASGGATKLVVSAPSSAVAGTVFSVTVTAVDQFGNTVTSYGGTVHFTSSDGQAVLPANSVLSNGVGSFSVTLKTAGSQTVTGTDTVTSSITGTSGPISVSFASGGATKLVVSAPSSAVAGTVFSVTVTAVDQFGNTVTSYGGTVHFTSSDGQAVLPANSVLSNGVGSFSVTLKTAGSQTVTGTDTVTSSITGTSGPISVSFASGGATKLVVSAPSSAVAGTVFSVTVTAVDQFGNTVTSYGGTVHFTSSDGQAVLPANSVLSNGVGSFSVTLKTAGSQTVTGTDTVTSSITGTSGPISVSFASGGATKLVVSAPSSAVAGTVFSVTVTAVDQFGNTVTSYGGTVHFTSSDGQAVLPANSVLSNGVGSFSVTLKTAGSQTVTGTDTVTSSITGTSGPISVSFASGGATKLVVSAPSSAVAGTVFSVTVTAVDQFGNTVTSYGGTVHFTSSDGQAVLPANSVLSNGVGSFSVTLKTAGSQTVTGTDTVTSSITGTSGPISVSFASGGATKLVVSAPSSAVAGTVFSVTVTAVDQFGNTVTSYGGTVHFTSSDGQAVLPANSVLSNGVGSFSVTLKTAGSQTVTGTDTVTSSITGSATLSVMADGVNYIVISPVLASLVAGGSKTYSVEAFDQFNNDLGDVTGLSAFMVNGTGVAGNVVSETLVGLYNVTASYNGLSASATLSVMADGVNYIVISPVLASLVAGGSKTYSVEAFDQFNNDLGDVTGLSAFMVNGTGVAGNVVSETLVGLYNVTASYNGLSASATLSVMADGVNYIVISPVLASLVAGGSKTYSVEAFDQFNNDLGDVTGLSAFMVNGTGVAGNVVSETLVGLYNVTASYNGLSASATLSVMADGVNYIVISPKTATIAAGGSQAYSTVGFDKFGNSLGIVAAVYSASAGASVTGNLVSSTVAGVFIVTATFNGKTDTATLTVTSVIIIPPSGVLDHIVIGPKTATIAAGGSQAYSTTGFDLYGNSLGSVAAVYSASAGASVTGNLVSSTVAGSYTVTASYGGKTDTAILTVTSAAGGATHLVVSAPAAAIAGTAFSISVTAKDQYGNNVTNYGGMVAFTSSDGQAVLPSNYTFVTVDAGSHVFTSGITLKTAGSQTIVATDTGSPSTTGSASVTVSYASGGANHFVVSATPTSVSAGSNINVNVTAADQFGNRVTGYTGTVHLTSTDGLASLPADSVLSLGTGMFSVTLKTGGPQTVTATDTVTITIMGISNTVTVSVPAGSTAHFVVSTPNSVTAGSSFNVNVTAVDQFGNRVTGYVGTVHFTSTSAGTLPGNSALSSGTGVFNITLTIAGSQNVTVTDTVNSSINGSATLTVTGYTITFNENGLASGTAWNITFGGTVYSSTINTITITEASAINYSWSTPSYIQLSQTRYATNQTAGSINVPSQLAQNIIYQTQYLVTYAISGNVLTVTVPPSEWVNSGGAATGIFPAQVINSQGDTRCNFVSDNRTSITRPTTVRATYQTQYYLTVLSAYGTANGAGWYNSGSIATASINSGTASGSSGTQYLFTTWSGDVSGTALTSSITMNNPKTATANWKTQYYLTIVTATGSPTGQGWYDAGSTANIGLSELVSSGTSTRQVFSGWTGSGLGAYTGLAATIQITMSGPITETASWIRQNLVTYVVTGNALPISLPTSEWVTFRTAALQTFPASVVNKANDTQCVFLNDNRPSVITAPTTITALYQTQYKVTFNQTGIESDATGVIITISNHPENYTQLPTTIWINNLDTINFTYENTVDATSANKQYTLTDTNATSPLTITAPTLVQGTYKPQFSTSLFTVLEFALIFFAILLLLLLLLAWRRRKKKQEEEKRKQEEEKRKQEEEKRKHKQEEENTNKKKKTQTRRRKHKQEEENTNKKKKTQTRRRKHKQEEENTNKTTPTTPTPTPTPT